MADDANLITLETDTGELAPLPEELANPEPPPSAAAAAIPEPAPVVPAPVVPAAVAEPANGWEREKAGILNALSAEREEKKALRDQVNRLTGMVEAIAKPTVTAPAAEAGPSPQDLEDTARSLGLYKADGSGQFDLVAAKNVLQREAARTEAAVQRLVKEQVQPLQAHVETQQAQQAINGIYEATRGKGIEDKFTQAAIQNLTNGDPRTLLAPGVQVLVALTAAGMKQMTAPGAAPSAAVTSAAAAAATAVVTGAPVVPAAPAPAPAPPAFVPDSGARPAAAAAPELSALEKRAMKAHGIKPEEHRSFTAMLDKANETGRFPAGGFALEE